MDQTIIIVVPEPIHQEMAAASARQGKSIEALARDALLEKYDRAAPGTAAAQDDPMIAVLRARGLLAVSAIDRSVVAGQPPDSEDPATLDQLGIEASVAFQQLGRALGDIVER